MSDADLTPQVVIEDIENVHAVKPAAVHAWLLPYGHIKRISVHRLKIFVEFESSDVANAVADIANGQEFYGAPVVVRIPEPWDKMVAGDLISSLEPSTEPEEVSTTTEDKSDCKPESGTAEGSSKEVNTELFHTLLAQTRFLDAIDTFHLFEEAEGLYAQKGGKTKRKSALVSGRPWLDKRALELLANKSKALEAFEKEPTEKNKMKLIRLDKRAALAAQECEERWLKLIDNEIAACYEPVLPEDIPCNPAPPAPAPYPRALLPSPAVEYLPIFPNQCEFVPPCPPGPDPFAPSSLHQMYDDRGHRLF
ncbi:unnamed protein product [Calicophoron daubneyi]|uniref:RRM domain-containing protein n=1 Tax=Calicophoron daubneyi TaxID=300641 RepID=A0AAV2T690_CALDB